MKKYIKTLIIFSSMGIVIGCKVSKDIETPQTGLPVVFRNAKEQDTAAIADISWKDFYKDPVLQKLIDSAIIRNYDMQLALKNVEQSQLQLRQSRWNNVPVVAFNAASSTSNPSDNSLNGLSTKQFLGTNHIEDFNANLSLSWEVDIWGKIRSKNKAALAVYLRTEEARKTIQTDLVAMVTQGYYNLLMLDEQLSVTQRNVQLNDSTLKIINMQFQAGNVTSLAVQQAQAQLLSTQQLIPELEENITIQENALRILSGELPAGVQRSTLLDQVIFPETLSAGLPSALISRRPDIKSRELELVLANMKVGVSKAEMYPALRITASAGVNSLKASNWFNIPASLFGIVGGSVLQPLLQRRELRTQYKVDLVEREKAVLLFRESVLKAVGEVSDALVRIEKLKVREAIAADRVKTLQQATSNANDLFTNGMASYLEVITAQGNVLQSELELASIRRLELSATSELYRSLGGGIK